MPRSLPASEIAAARARLSLSPQQMAAKLLIPLEQYEALEAGRQSPTRAEAFAVRWLVADRANQEALAAAGVPACRWMQRHERAAPPPDAPLERLAAHEARAEEHAEECPACLERQRWVEAHCPPMPVPPMSPWARLMAWGHAQPAWLRPALGGALLMGIATAVRAAFVLPARWSGPMDLLRVAGVIGLCALAGAVGGLAYSVLARPLLRVPVAGAYLAGIVSATAFVVVVFAALHLMGELDATGLGALFLGGVGALVGGLAVGHGISSAARARDA